MGRDVAGSLLPRDVIRLKTGSRRGFGRKVVVAHPIERLSESVSINWFLLRKDRAGDRFLGDPGWTSFRNDEPVEVIGVWRDGEMRSGAPGWLQINGESPQKGVVARMATSSRTKKRGAAKPAAKSKSNGGESRTRASADELDRLAAKVVDLRDNKEKSWSDIEEALDIAPGRLRSLYNRGGGEPRERAAATPPKKAASGRAGKKRSAKR